MTRSDSSGASGRRGGGIRGQTLTGSTTKTTSLSGVETLLRAAVAGTGFALIAIALWHVATETSIPAVMAVLGSETTKWVVVVFYGCALVTAARISRGSNDRRW